MQLFRITYTNGNQEMVWASTAEIVLGCAYISESRKGGTSFRDIATVHAAEVPPYEAARLQFETKAVYERPALPAEKA